MKRDTHEGEQERVVSAQCEQGVKAQQEEPENGERPGASRKGRGGGNRNTIWVIFFCLCHNEAVKATHTLPSHTQPCSLRDSRAAGDAGKTRRDHLKSRRVNSQEQQIEKRECGLWAVAQVASGFPKCFQVYAFAQVSGV